MLLVKHDVDALRIPLSTLLIVELVKYGLEISLNNMFFLVLKLLFVLIFYHVKKFPCYNENCFEELLF